MPVRLHTFFRYFPVSDRDRRFGLYLTTAGESRIPPRFPYPPLGHPGGYQFDWRKGRILHEYQIVYISRGQGRLETREHEWPVTAGTVFLLHPGAWHRYRPDPTTGWNEHWVGCDGPVVRGLVRQGFFSPRRPVQPARDEDLLLGAFSSVVDAIHAGRPALQQVAAGMTLYILALLYSARQPGQAGPPRTSRAIHEAMRLMADPAHELGPLPPLARSLGVSYTWFRRAFAHHTGMSPHQYQLQLRIGRARTLLSETTLAVKEIAFRSGFESEQYFCRLFKAKTGVSPGAWRRRYGGENLYSEQPLPGGARRKERVEDATHDEPGAPMNAITRSQLANIRSADRHEQGAAYSSLMKATSKPVDWAYEAWDELLEGLRHKDNRVRSISAQLLCNLAKSDPRGRMLKDFKRLLAGTKDPQFVTARHTLESLWHVGVVGEKNQAMVVAGLKARFQECGTEKNGTLIRYDILQGLRRLYDAVKDEGIRKQALALIATEKDPKYGRKYASVWR